LYYGVKFICRIKSYIQKFTPGEVENEIATVDGYSSAGGVGGIYVKFFFW